MPSIVTYFSLLIQANVVIWIESGKTTLGIIHSLVEYTLQEAYDLIYLVYGI